MQPFLKENIAKLRKVKQALPLELRIPVNAGRITGVKGTKTLSVGGFSTAIPNDESVKLTEWLNYKADRGDLTSFIATSSTTVDLSSATTIDASAATTFNLAGLPTYADDAAAVVGGLVTGDVYQTATGELRIVIP